MSDADDDRERVWGRIGHPEDGLTERKPEGAGERDFKETIVAFANSVPEGAEGVLFVGVADSGKILGCGGVDSLQRTIARICANECYPPINARFESRYMDEGKAVLAVVVPHSAQRPHFLATHFCGSDPKIARPTKQLTQNLLRPAVPSVRNQRGQARLPECKIRSPDRRLLRDEGGGMRSLRRPSATGFGPFLFALNRTKRINK